eukprot:8489416-Alexandrium_andersonii.AAC.1
MVGPSRIDLTRRAPAHADPVRQLHGLDLRFWTPTRNPHIDREVSHHIAGPDQLALGYQFPSFFAYNWLRPAPLAREIRFKGTCRKCQCNLCHLRNCKRPRLCAGCSGEHPVWMCKGR